MYVEDVEDGKRTYTHIFAHNFLNIQLIQPRAVMLCMSKTSKMRKEHTHTFKALKSV